MKLSKLTLGRLLDMLGLRKLPTSPTPTPTPVPTPTPAAQRVNIVVSVFDGDPAKDKKIAGVIVHLVSETHSVSVNADAVGNALVENVPVGTYTVRIAHDGYGEIEQTIRVQTPNEWFTVSLTRTTPVVTFGGRLRRDGRFLVNDHGTFRINFADALSILARTDDEVRAYLDWVVTTGFNGIRIFCGHLGWSVREQTLQLVYERLGFVLDESRKRGLYVEVTAITGSANGFDVRQHLATINSIVRPFDNVIVELANEPYHPTQSEDVHKPEFLRNLRGYIDANILVAYGAAADDENSEMAGGDYVTAHLDRGRDEWNMVRRVRELEVLSDTNRKHVVNNEPIKAGSQNKNPAIYFTMALLNRGFEVGGVFHSDAGLQSVVHTGEQQALAEAWVRGATLVKTQQRMTFKNASWADSPIESFDGALVRAYSFVSAEESITVVLGITGNYNIKTKNGWSLGPVIAEMPGVKVFKLVR